MNLSSNLDVNTFQFNLRDHIMHSVHKIDEANFWVTAKIFIGLCIKLSILVGFPTCCIFDGLWFLMICNKV